MTMTAADGLIIQLAADVARLRADMNEANRVVQGGASTMGNAMGGLKNMIGGLAAGMSVAAFAGWINGAIDAADATKEFSQKTGVAIKDVAGLQLGFRQGGVESEALLGSIAKLSKNMAEGSDGFKKLGIETRNADGTMRNVKDVIYDVADATKAMGNTTERAVILQDLFGKSAQALIPTLDGGSEGLRDMADMAERLGLVIDDKTADAADQFGDTIDLLHDSSKGMATQMAAQLLPTLNAITGAMLDSTGESDNLKIAGDALAIVLKTLYTAGVLVGGAIKTLGGDIGATAAAIMTAAKGDFSGAMNIMKDRAKDAENEWKDRLKGIANVWKETSNTTVTAVAEMNAQQKKNVVQTKEQETAIKDADKAYSTFKNGLESYRNELKSQLVEGDKLSKAQKILADLTANNTDEVKKLSTARRNELIAMAKETIEYENQAKAVDESTKAAKKLHEELTKKNQTIDDEIQKQKESNAEIENGKEASMQLEVAKLREQAAIADSNAAKAIESGLNKEISGEYTAQAEKLRELADLKEKGIHIQAAKDAKDEWKKTTDAIGDGLTDALMRGFESGKGFAENMKDTLINMFKTMVLKPTIQMIMGQGQGQSGGIGGLLDMLSGKNGSAMGSKIAGLASKAGEWLSSKGMEKVGGWLGGNAGTIGKLAGGASNIMAGYGIGSSLNSAISGEYQTNKTTQTVFKVATVAASAVFGPIGGAIVGAIGGLVNRAFGMGDKKVKESGIMGTISGEDFSGQTYADWKQKGGWFRKDKKGTDYGELNAETADALGQGAASMYGEIMAYAAALKLPSDSLKKVSYSLKVQMGEDAKANEAAINAEFAKYQELLANQFKNVLTPFQKAGETLTQTMGRLAAIQGFNETMNQFGGVFSRIATLGIDATSSLLEFAGGIDAFIEKTQAFVNDYYTEEEKMAMQAKDLNTILKASGVNGSDLKSREDFRALVEKQDVNTEEGRRLLSLLLDIAPSFAQVGDYLKENKTNLDELAGKSPQTALLENILDGSKSQNEKQQQVADGITKLDGTMEAVGNQIANAISGMTSSIINSQEEYYRRMAMQGMGY